MKADSEIKRDVEEELSWDPDIDDTDIAVSVTDGVVTLTGFARSCNDKFEAEAAAKRMNGVRGVSNDIEIRLPITSERTDPEIARDAVAAIKSQLPHSPESIKVVVKSGWVSLEGEVAWHHWREIAERTVRRLLGVKGVSNWIKLKSTIAPKEVKSRIIAAFHRSAQLDADRITVEPNGSEVVLKGTVRSWAERYEAERAASAAPGVTNVDNRITVN